jgi:hypothetical protein
MVLCISTGIIIANLFPSRFRGDRHFHRLSAEKQRRIVQQVKEDAETWYDFFETALRAISDAQILLALALAISFIILDDCNLLQYHWDVGVRLLLLACANYLQTLAYVRRILRPFQATLAAILRFLAVLAILFILGSILVAQYVTPLPSGQQRYVPEVVPPNTRNDSAILLKAICFLDRDSQQYFGTLDDQDLQSIGLYPSNVPAPEWIFWILLVVAIGLVGIARIIIACCHRKQSEAVDIPTANFKSRTCPSPYEIMYWVLPWLLTVAVFIYSAATIAGLRGWAGGSGWLATNPDGSNPENSVGGFGQTASLVALAAVLITGLDAAADSKDGRKPQKTESHERKGA